MPRYFFSIANGSPFEDVDGLELEDVAAARAEAAAFARDIMRMQPRRRDWSAWTVRVTDENRNLLFETPFSDLVQR